MSVRYKGDIVSRRLSDAIELFVEEKQFDGFVTKAQPISLGQFPAQVEQMRGGRFAYYQSIGYSHPMIITMRDPEVEFHAIRHNGRDIVVKNKTIDPANSNFITITADYTGGQV